MAREFSVIVGIDAGRARRGAREFNAAANTVSRGSRKMQRGLKSANRSAVAMITTLGRLRGVATVVFSGFLGVGGITSVIRTLSQFETAISSVKALISAQSPSSLSGAMSNLTDKARELGATTLFTATQAAEGMKFLTLAGFEALEVYQAIEPALNLAAAGMLDLGQAADIVSNIMAAFSVDASRTEEVVDALAFTAARTNTNIQQLGEAMKFVGPVAGTLGVNVQETSVALGILGNSGLQASLAGTSLRRVMSGLLNPSKEAQKIFADMGVTQEQLVDTLQGEKGIVNLIDLLAKKGIDAADAFTLFGQRGAPGLLSLVNQREKLRKLTDDLEDIEGVAKRMARILADNLGGDGRIALSALQEAILQLGEAGLTEWLRSVTQGFTGFIRGVSGVQTPVEDLTASMEKGIRIGEKFRKNWDLIRNVALGLAIVLSRNLIVSLARTILMFGTNAIAALTSFALSMRGASIATVLLTGTLNLLKTALVTTGLGALVVGIGYLADWILFSDDAADSTTEFADKLDLLRKEATDAAFAFDAFGEARRKAALVTLEARLVAEQTALRDATNQLRSYQSAQESQEALIARVADAQQRFNEELGKGAGSSEFNEAQQRLEFYQDQLSRLKTLLETTDPIQLAAKIEELQENVKLAAEDLAAANKVMDGTASSMADARGEIEGTTKAMQEFIDEFKKLTGLEQADALSFKELLEEAEPAAKAIAEVQEKMDLLTKVAALTDTQLEKLGVTKAQLAKVEALLAHEMEEATAKMNDQEKAAKKVADEAQKIIDRLYPMRTLTREYYREAEQLTAEMIRQGDSMEEVREALLRLRGEYDENIRKLEETCEKNREVRECTEDSAKRIQQIWEQSMRNIQDAFADFFRNGLSDFDNFADSLLDAFKDMIANMLAAWFASGLMNIFQGKAFGAGGNSLMSGVGSLFGGGGSGGGGTGVSGIGTAIKGMSKAFSTFAVNAAFFFEGAKQFLMGNATSTQLGAVSGYAGAGAAVAGAGLGAASGFVVDSIVGSRGKPKNTLALSAIGGAIGSIFGPIGSLIGGALGAFASNLLGGAKKLESATLTFGASMNGLNAEVETVISKQKSFFRGRKFTTTTEAVDTGELNDALLGVVETIQGIAGALGVSADALKDFNLSKEFNIKGKSEEQILQLVEDFFNDSVQGLIKTFVENTEGLSTRLKTVVMSFNGNTESMIRAFELAAAIDMTSAIDPIKTVQDAIADSNKTLGQTYAEVRDAYIELIENYDGSIQSLEELAQATSIYKQVQIALAQALITAGEEISATFQGSAQSIREQLMAEDELYELRRSQIDDLVAQAMNTTDPAELARLADEINTLGLDAWNLLDEDQKAALGEEFVNFFEGLDELFAGQIGEGLSNLDDDSSALDQEVATAMTDAAQAIIDANNEARELWEEWREWLRNNRYGSRVAGQEMNP